MSGHLRNLMPEILTLLSLPLLFGVLLLLGKMLLKTWLSNAKAGFNFRAKPIMTANEREFFQRLLRANSDGYVFPQVAFSALLEPALAKNRWAAFKYISQKRVDYALYNDKLELLCIVELDDRSHNPKKDAQRDAAFASAGITTVRWQSTHKPDEAQIRTRLAQLKLSETA